MINGKTKLYAIIADPISHVRTPEVFNELFSLNCCDAVLVPIQVAPEGLKAVLAAFRAMKNLGGFVTTVPHKTAVAALCDELGDAGRAIGAVNAVRRETDGRLIGNMFDGAGFVAGLRSQGYDPVGRRALLVGAGGAAAAIAFALVEAGVASLTVANRTRSKAEEIAVRIAKYFPDRPIVAGNADPAGHDLVINATSLGLKADDPLPIDTTRLTPAMTVAEIIMKPETTQLLAAAKARGCTIHYGRHMLDEQVRLIADFIGAMGS
ncbi:MAG: shikimate dehydrogenase [Desulfuromonadaceae bacterium]|nr:shikimate dehydrogenase [Desulfuromonadaceae bacterium]MDD2855256.1 shikimate dehydrogenase [Desulfuromonadaceae bacterium]